ncbi:trans-sialidase [Trypanosoma cruzi Dm28c]|uniref:Trans-sialidase n=2 Tax=Trypanosoma cruzi TaxID=5693 RepID=V5D5K2_TRYCR|nr:trans-sialidase [Trypanosoma cruzi Dm28c]PBJ79081.1 trans-sialidase [Trypanosoma cruzi cruzi]PWV01037.1 putative trans-sialidase, Group V [Trypanosoma cruzi]
MHSRVAAVKAPRTHNRRRVTGSSGRREGRESEPQRPDMSRRVFASAALLLLAMVCCGTGGTAASDAQSSEPNYKWKDITDGVTVDSLSVPGLLKVGSDVFAVAEAQCKKDVNTVFTGIASRLLTNTADNKPEEVLKGTKDTQVLEEVISKELTKELGVSRPTAVVKGSDIYMLVGKYGGEGDAACQGEFVCGLFLLKGGISGEGSSKKIGWTDTKRLPKNIFGDQLKSLSQLIGGGGSGVKMKDGTIVFPVEGTKKNGNEKDEKTVSLITYSSDAKSWTLSKGMSADGCSVPSVVEWGEDKLMMMTVCDDGRRRVYEIGDNGESWTEALGTLSRVWGNNHKRNEKGVRSGFSTAKIDNRNVMLFTLPVYSEKAQEKENEKGVLHLWLTDNTHIVDIGPVSGDDDAAASSLLYKSGDNNEEELIALYEKRKGGGEKPSPGMISVRLTEQLQRVKDVLTTWKKVDERVTSLCPSENAEHDSSTTNRCGAVKITDGLVGFLSGNFSGTTWKDEYLGVDATITKEEGATVATENPDGVTFKRRGAWAEWPVGKQGENQLYHFANHNFTLVATVSIHKVPKEGSIPLIGAKLNDSGKTVLLGLSYNNEKKRAVLCSGGKTREHSSTWEPDTAYQVAIVLQNGTQSSAYVDGQRVGGDEQCKLETTNSNEISHFYIGGDEDSAGNQEDVSVTVTNVLLYNRPLSSEEIGALNPNKAPIPLLVKEPSTPSPVASDSIIPPITPVTKNAQMAGTSSTPVGTQLTEREQPMGSSGADSGGASTSAVSTVSTPSAEKDSVKQAASRKSSDKAQTVDGGSTADGEPTMEKREGTDGQKEEVQPLNRDENATALNSSLGKLSQGNNTDAATVRGSGLLSSLLLLLGLWGLRLCEE